jgi:hypothetical protein
MYVAIPPLTIRLLGVVLRFMYTLHHAVSRLFRFPLETCLFPHNAPAHVYKVRDFSCRRKRADSSVCYPGVGCFQDSGPFGYLDMLPSPPEEVSTRFFLYSGRARANSPAMDVPFSNLTAVWPWASKSFNLSAPTKVIVHGFGGSCGHVWVYEMRSALMTVVSN